MLNYKEVQRNRRRQSEERDWIRKRLNKKETEWDWVCKKETEWDWMCKKETDWDREVEKSSKKNQTMK